MDRDEILQNNPLVPFLRDRGVELRGEGLTLTGRRCAKVQHGKDHWCLSVDPNKHLWHCNDCDVGGTVIDWLMMADNLTTKEAMAKLGGNGSTPEHWEPPKGSQIVATYSYRDELGNELYQCVRYSPKTFKQRRMVNGEWIPSIEGVKRVLYKLPEVLKAERVWIVEGEKDVETLCRLGYVATCNVCGAGRWMDGYTESLLEKEVVLCGDNDEPGRKHIKKVFESIAGKVKNTRTIVIPAPHKDVSDFVASFSSPQEARESLDALVEKAVVLTRGLEIPVKSLWEIEPSYSDYAKTAQKTNLNIGSWLPSLKKVVRPLVPGEILTFVADTGVGKTAILCNLAIHATELTILFFELELPEQLLYERVLSAKTRMPCAEIERGYAGGEMLGSEGLRTLSHIFVCTKPRLTIQKVEEIIIASELKIGRKPNVVMIDYMQLVHGKGERYERLSDAAEGLKTVANQTQVVLVIGSQIQRPPKDKTGKYNPVVGLHSAKDTGAIENSSGLVIGAWRDSDDGSIINLRVLKNTKGASGATCKCKLYGETMRIVELENSPVLEPDNRTPDPQRTTQWHGRPMSQPYPD